MQQILLNFGKRIKMYRTMKEKEEFILRIIELWTYLVVLIICLLACVGGDGTILGI